MNEIQNIHFLKCTITKVLIVMGCLTFLVTKEECINENIRMENPFFGVKLQILPDEASNQL
jgi:hypothetical protein